MLHRIAWDCKMPSLLYQASLFRTFQAILRDSTRSDSPGIQELATFAKFIVRKFVEKAKNNPTIYVELLFWKNKKLAYEIEEGYGSTQTKSKAGKILWTEEQEYELERLHTEFSEKVEEGKDIADHILDNLIDKTKTRRHVLRELKRQNLELISKKKKGTSRKPKENKKGNFLDSNRDYIRSEDDWTDTDGEEE
jgi:timeless